MQLPEVAYSPSFLVISMLTLRPPTMRDNKKSPSKLHHAALLTCWGTTGNAIAFGMATLGSNSAQILLCSPDVTTFWVLTIACLQM